VAVGEGPEFKSQYRRKKKERKKPGMPKQGQVRGQRVRDVQRETERQT
jgi:hypothetical protein